MHCKHLAMEVNVRPKIQSETRNSNTFDCLRLYFLLCTDRHMVVLTVKKKTFFPVHCKHYHMEVNAGRKVPSQTEKFRLVYLSTIVFFASDRLPYGKLTVNKKSCYLLHCKLYHMEFDQRQKIPAKSFGGKIGPFFCLRSPPIWQCLQWTCKILIGAPVTITIWQSIRDKEIHSEMKNSEWGFFSDWIIYLFMNVLLQIHFRMIMPTVMKNILSRRL